MTELIKNDPASDTGAMALIHAAIDKGIGVEGLEKLVALQERIQDRNAASEFASAMAEFQRECPEIRKTSTAQITTKGGSTYSYSYAELDEIARTVRPLMHKLGLSYSWDSRVDGGTMTVKCTVRHVNGHSESATFACPVEGSPSMSTPQKHAATLTFARRQALVQVLGLTMCDPDTDAMDAPSYRADPISDDQVTQIEVLLEDTGSDRAKFLEWLGVESVGAMTTADFGRALRALKAKRAK